MSDPQPPVEVDAGAGPGPDEGPLPDPSAVAAIEAELDDVARALERLDEGTYGTCEVCAATLPDERLAAAPAARRCTEHAP